MGGGGAALVVEGAISPTKMGTMEHEGAVVVVTCATCRAGRRAQSDFLIILLEEANPARALVRKAL